MCSRCTTIILQAVQFRPSAAVGCLNWTRLIAAMIVAANARTSPLSALVLHHFHGAPTRVHSEATAFGPRQEHFLLEAIAAWCPSANDNAAGHRLWAQNVSDCAVPASPAGHRDQAAKAVTNIGARLSEVKQIYDPEYALSALPPRQRKDLIPAHVSPGSQW